MYTRKAHTLNTKHYHGLGRSGAKPIRQQLKLPQTRKEKSSLKRRGEIRAAHSLLNFLTLCTNGQIMHSDTGHKWNNEVELSQEDGQLNEDGRHTADKAGGSELASKQRTEDDWATALGKARLPPAISRRMCDHCGQWTAVDGRRPLWLPYSLLSLTHCQWLLIEPPRLPKTLNVQRNLPNEQMNF